MPRDRKFLVNAKCTTTGFYKIGGILTPKITLIPLEGSGYIEVTLPPGSDIRSLSGKNFEIIIQPEQKQ